MDKLISKFKLGNNKKQIENIVIFIILLIIVIIVINNLFAETSKDINEDNKVNVVSDDLKNDELERKLENILSLMSGVGNARVMVSYSNTIEQIPMYDVSEKNTTIKEQDVNGGKRETTEISNEQNIIYEEQNSSKIPAIKQTIMPEVIGVIVIAEGANNSVIKENIKNAVEAVVNISPNHIQVFAK